MTIPLDKLMKYSGNKYVFARAGMQVIERIANVKDYPEENLTWKVVPNVLKELLDEKIHFDYEANSISEGGETKVEPKKTKKRGV